MSDSQILDQIATVINRESGLPGIATFTELAALLRASGRKVGPPPAATTCPVCREGNVKADVTVTLEKVGSIWEGISVWESVNYFCTSCDAEYDDGSPDAEEFFGVRSAVLLGMDIKE